MLTRLTDLAILAEGCASNEFADAAVDLVHLKQKRLQHAIVPRDAQSPVAEFDDRQPLAVAPLGSNDDPRDIPWQMIHLG